MKYLLDVNILAAWGWADHVDHERTVIWLAAARRRRQTTLLTSAIPELGFVCVSVQRTGGRVTVAEATDTLADMVASLGPRHRFLPDDQAIRGFPSWCRQASRTTDAHLLRLADAHGARLATLDAGIPQAFLIPVSARPEQ